MNIDNLKDGKHWVGYAITLGAIIAIGHYRGIHMMHTPTTNVVLIGIALIVADTINHNLKLQ